MTRGQRAGEGAIAVDVEQDKSYYWCSCGKSSKQPFCDGSHKGTEFNPVVYKAKLAILSNGTPSLLDELVKINNLDNLFDNLFSIEEVGIYKPDSKVYDLPIKKYKIEKNEVAFLSANTWDVSGGGNYGFHSIWVNRNNSIFDNLDYKPQNEIKNLSELTKLI